MSGYIDVEGMRSAASTMNSAASDMRTAAGWFGEHARTIHVAVQDFQCHSAEMIRAQKELQDRQIKIDAIRAKIETIRFTIIMMQAENFSRMQRHESLAYGEEAFMEQARKMQELTSELEAL